MNKHECQICHNIYRHISRHIKNMHNLDPKLYYDTYFKQDSNEGICPVCNNNTVFLGITYGYRKHCSTSCSSYDPNVKAKNKATNLARYGVEHNWNKGELRKHQEETMLKKYGVTHNWQSSKLRSKEKFKISELEQYFIDKLNELNLNYEYRYFDESGRYPYECDFYIYNIDTFIEINGTSLHDDHIFNPNNQNDIQKLNYYKSRIDSSWYQSKVRIWLKDHEKFNTATKNKLNYIILWNKTDIDNYVFYLKTSTLA